VLAQQDFKCFPGRILSLWIQMMTLPAQISCLWSLFWYMIGSIKNLHSVAASMFLKRFLLSCVAVLLAVCLSGCGSSNSQRVSVAVSAATTTVDPANTVTLTATVTNDKNSAGVTWTQSGVD
jgi:hypothetical protein